MSWEDNIKEAAYTSPSGVRTVFDYTDVEKSVDKKTSVYEFPETNGSYVQDLGHTGFRYPLSMIFAGSDYDVRADAFETALLENGVGVLEHPIYGVKNVVPFGAITRKDALATGANMCTVEVTFFETILAAYPANVADPASMVKSAANTCEAATAEQFAADAPLDDTAGQASVKNQFSDTMARVKEAMTSVTIALEDAQSKYNEIETSITGAMDLLILTPLTLAFQAIQLVKSPFNTVAGITASLEAYANLMTEIMAPRAVSTGYSSATLTATTQAADFTTSTLFASAVMVGSVSGVLKTTFGNRTEALEAAEQLQTMLADYTTWRDNKLAELYLVDSGEGYATLIDMIALCVGYIAEISFSLKRERAIVTVSPRSIIDLCAELYGGVDEYLDFFITSNSLTGSEILEIPTGRTIKYYV